MTECTIIVVTYNTREMTLACLRSIFKYAPIDRTEVIVVDNASVDGSAYAIAKEFPQARLIRNECNRGFAAANNQGLQIARGRYILLLNSDTEINSETLGATIRFADANPDAGIIGVRCYLPTGVQQSTIFRDKTLLDCIANIMIPHRWMRRLPWVGRSRYVGLDLNQIHDVDSVAGCFMLVRRELYAQIGGMDEQFFMYGEEAEWCYRARHAGWSVRYYPGAHILHYGGVSAASIPSEMGLAMARSSLLLLKKTRGRFVAWLANLCMLLRDLPRVAAWGVCRIAGIHKWKHCTLSMSLERAAQRFPLHVRSVFGLE